MASFFGNNTAGGSSGADQAQRMGMPGSARPRRGIQSAPTSQGQAMGQVGSARYRPGVQGAPSPAPQSFFGGGNTSNQSVDRTAMRQGIGNRPQSQPGQSNSSRRFFPTYSPPTLSGRGSGPSPGLDGPDPRFQVEPRTFTDPILDGPSGPVAPPQVPPSSGLDGPDPRFQAEPWLPTQPTLEESGGPVVPPQDPPPSGLDGPDPRFQAAPWLPTQPTLQGRGRRSVQSKAPSVADMARIQPAVPNRSIDALYR